MGMLRGLKDKIHKGDSPDKLKDVNTESDDSFLHMTSKETGAADTTAQREQKGGSKSVY